MIERVYFVCTSIASLRLVDCAIALLISRPRSQRLLPNANILAADRHPALEHSVARLEKRVEREHSGDAENRIARTGLAGPRASDFVQFCHGSVPSCRVNADEAILNHATSSTFPR